MSSTVIAPIATRIANIGATVSGVTAYDVDPGMAGLEGNPALVVSLPDIDRGELDSDSQLGYSDWMLTYPVSIYVDLDVVADSVTLLRDTTEAFIRAVDADEQLGGTVAAASVLKVSPAVDVGNTSRPRLVSECSVMVHAFVA